LEDQESGRPPFAISFGGQVLYSHPDMWQKVVQLSHQFNANDLDGIRRFYYHYGPLGYPTRQEPSAGEEAEPWGWCMAALRWFQQMTTLQKLIEEERTDALWECFGKSRKTAITAETAATNIYFRDQPTYDYRDYGWRFYARGFAMGPGGLEWRSPPDERQLYAAAMDLVSKAASLELQKIPLVPLETTRVKGGRPKVLWGYRPQGMFHAAFLQWFFQHLAGTDTVTCEAEGCSRAVLPPQKKYCSERCAQRTRIARYRAKSKRNKASTMGDEEGIDMVRRAVKEGFGWLPSPATAREWIENAEDEELV
jgi:hypothetical protein